MTGINYGRVILGGLAAGVVANIWDGLVAGTLQADDMERMAQRLNLSISALNSPRVAMTWVIVDFIYATLIVWTYAAIRPRFGPGPKTAVTAGLVLWAAVAVVLTGFQGMGIFTPDSFIKSAALTLVSTILASLVGGYLYKETP
jgi:hypothetical protein